MTELSVTLPDPGPSANLSSQHTAFLPGYELTWSAAHFHYNDATAYTGTYYDGTAYSNITTIAGGRLLAFKQALVSSGWVVEQSSTTTHVLAGDLWTNAPDIERGTGHWIVLRGPDGVSQLVIQKDYVIYTRTHYFHWSPGGLFTVGTVSTTRPTATDELGPAGDSSDYADLRSDAAQTVGAFYAFKGTRGTEITSRVLQIDAYGGGKIQFMLNLEWFVTDLPIATYPRNICVLAFNTYYTKTFWDKEATRIGKTWCNITMPDGKCATPISMYCPYAYPGHWPSEYVGTLDAKSRMLPVYIQEYTTSGNHQFFGYIPDMYFGNNDSPLASWYSYRTFGGLWSRWAELCIPVFATEYATTLGDSPAVAAVIATASESMDDVAPPTFAGIVSAAAVDPYTIRLAWDYAYDDFSMHAALSYEIHYSTSAAAEFEIRSQALGTITHDVTLLKPGTTYYFRVRCRDEAGNVDANAVELSATTTEPPATDLTAPAVTIESPAPNSRIAPSDTIVARVTDAGGLRNESVFAYYPSRPTLPWEVVRNSLGFEPVHFSQSTRSELIADKDYRYYIRRNGGWPAPPRLHFDPIDTSGNEIT